MKFALVLIISLGGKLSVDYKDFTEKKECEKAKIDFLAEKTKAETARKALCVKLTGK